MELTRSVIVASCLFAAVTFCVSQSVAVSSSCAEEQSSEQSASADYLERAPQAVLEDEDELSIYNQQFSGSCGKHFKSVTRIAGGYNARPGEFPSYVQLIADKGDGKSMLCGGALISQSLILTAAHCVRNGRGVLARASLKDIDSSSLVKWVSASKVCRSKLYNADRTTNDVAIVKLERKIQLSREVQTVCLPSAPLDRNTQAYAVGLGRYFGFQRPRNLQVLPVKRSSCPKLSDLHVSKVCFAASDSRHKGNVCVGDSGGPVIAIQDGKQTVFGLTSYKHKDVCRAGFDTKAVFLDVFNMRHEINKLIKLCEQ